MQWAYIGSTDMLEYELMKSPMGSQAAALLGPEPALGVFRRDLQNRLGRWLVNHHGAQWRGLGDTQRQAREFISGPSLDTRAKFFTFNRTQSRVVSGLLTGHNTLRRHLYLLGLFDSLLRRKCRVRQETSVHILCECEALASLKTCVSGLAPFSWSRRILRF